MKRNNLVFYSACMGMLLFGMVMVTLGSILPTITAKFQLTEIEAGYLLSILPFGILTGSLLFGPIVDRYGYKALLISCSFIVLTAMEGIAYAEQIPALNISVFFIGFGGGVLNGATNALVADISSETKGANLSLLGVFYGIGALGMPTILNVLKNIFSTEGIISSVGAFILLVTLMFFFINFPKPKLAQGFPIRDGIKLLKSPALFVAGMFLFFASGLEGIANNWLTSYLEKVRSIDAAKALFGLSALAMSLTVARLFLGKFLSHFSTQKIFFIGLFIGVVAVAILHFSGDYFVILSGIILLGIGMAASFPLMLGFVAELYANLSGTAFSVVLAIALTGNMVINYSMGVSAQAKGISTWPMLLIICLISMIFLLWLFLFLTRNQLKSKS